jgi:hypothetical protein
VHNYFTQGPGNNMQIRSNVDEYNAVGNSSYAQWNMVMGASLDVFSIRRSPAGSTYDEDALFWIEGDTGKVGIATVDTSNGASIPYTLQARLEVQTDSGTAIRGRSLDTSGSEFGVYGLAEGTLGRGVYGWALASTGDANGVFGRTNSSQGSGVYGWSNSSTGSAVGVTGQSNSSTGRAVYGYASHSNGTSYGVFGYTTSTNGYDFYAGGYGTNYGPFTGAHEVRLSDSFPAEIRAGMIVSGVGEAHIRETPDGDVDISSTLPTVRLSDRAEDKAVLGVLVGEVELPEDHWYSPAAGERFASVNALGEGRVWVTNINGGIEAGDAITSSEIPGYGQRQDDDLLHIYTLGKAMETVDWDTVTETVTFNGQEYKVYLLAVVYTSG